MTCQERQKVKVGAGGQCSFGGDCISRAPGLGEMQPLPAPMPWVLTPPGAPMGRQTWQDKEGSVGAGGEKCRGGEGIEQGALREGRRVNTGGREV